MEIQDDGKPIPRSQRTPTTEAGEALTSALQFHVELFEWIKSNDPQQAFSDHPGVVAGGEAFFDMVLDDALNNPEAVDGDGKVDELALLSEHHLIQVALIVIDFAVQAANAEARNERELAWTYAADAMHWAGVLNGCRAEQREQQDGSNAAAQLAKRRHAESRALAEFAVKHWRENIDQGLSAQKAASELSRVVPLSHKKLAELVSAAKKGKSPW
ncbi:hypothetical protein PP715_03125 [Ralstonia solanacearum]|uniref:Uncharacterized protein n=2 Tax=Ralstonia solanacearum TaxID=305 RepID=A0A5H2PHU8_RALSL|nr:hypothetical protein [Ralstonia solanacearum]AEG68268.1 hypothetical protein RSPO_c00967 [Ralstonia solanacearum Po82]AMP69554.1 hypothetical protein UW163_08775 [Ralstonia solanacearum]AYB59934.1 hypothetical protein C2124_04690 [Ralstonia solanacearum]MBB6586736.1 hypothetical protein [Ralstonia solanacearum]MCG3573306.1 hypothetical protein [Ralstonia solanacearum]